MSFLQTKVVACIDEVNKLLETGVRIHYDGIVEDDIVNCTLTVDPGACADCVLPTATMEDFVVAKLRRKLPWIKRVVIRGSEAGASGH